MEEKFGTPHPVLEGFVEPHRYNLWLVDAFFRLHRRRMLGDTGFQPLSLNEMSAMADQVLRVPEDDRPLFFRVMEHTDNSILLDHYNQRKEQAEDLQQSAQKSPRVRK